MVDSSRWCGARGGPEVRAGQGASSTRSSLKEGEESFLEQARARPRLRRRRRRDGVRRAGPGRHASSARSRSAAAPTTCSSTRPGFPPEDIVFDPNVLAVATGIEEHDGYAKSVHRRAAADQGALSRCAHLAAASRTSSSPSAATTVVREAMHAAFLYHAIRAGPRHGHRQRRASSRSTRTSSPSCSSASRTCSSTGGRTRPSGSSSSPSRSRARATKRERRPLLARGAGRGAPRARARARHRRLHRGGHRGGAAGSSSGRST